MLSPGLIKFLFYISGPAILVRIITSRRRSNANSSDTASKKPTLSLGDYITYISLAVFATAYLATATYHQSENIFKRIDVDPRASCYRIRLALADFGHNNPQVLPPDSNIPTLKEKTANADVLEYYQGSEYGQMDFLVDRFCKYEEDKNAYLRFGQTIFLNSISSDFGPRGISPRITTASNNEKNSGSLMSEFPDVGLLLYAVASHFFVYLPVFVLAGMLTTPFMVTGFAPSRMNVRPWFIIILCTLFSADLYWLFTVPTSTKLRTNSASTMWILSPDMSDPLVFFADASEYTRKLLLGTSLLLFIAIDYMLSSRQTDVQLLKQCISEQSDGLVVAKNHTVLETSVFMCQRLRDRLVAVWKREQLARESLFTNGEFVDKYDRVSETTKSKQWADQTAASALDGLSL